MRTKTSPSPYKRHKTRWPGVTYRLAVDGSRNYSVHWQGTWVRAGKTEDEARAKQAELHGKKSRGEIVLPAKKTFATVAAEHLADPELNLRPGWRAEYERMLRRDVLPRLGARPIGSFRPKDITVFAARLQAEGRSESYAANILKPVRGVFDFAAEKDYIQASPFRLLSDKQRKRLPSCNTQREHREWTSEDVETLIAVGYERDQRPESLREYGLIIELKLRLGLRLGELLGAHYGDFEKDGDAVVLHVRRQWTKDGRVDEPKTKKSLRRVPVPAGLYAKVAARKLQLGAGGEDFVSARRPGALPVSHSNFRRRAWDPAVKDAGFDAGPRVSPHDARHAAASFLASRGLDSRDIAETLGHSSPQVTERIYVAAFDRAQREQRIREAMSDAR